MQNDGTFTYKQSSPYCSPRPAAELAMQFIWQCCWSFFCAWTPKPFNPWRLLWLRLFGARLSGTPFVHGQARIHVPWNLIMHDRAALGQRSNAYNLGEIELHPRSTVAQEAYLCTATHEFEDKNLPLKTAKITVGEDAFIGARAFLMPGVTVGKGTVIGAGSVVTKDIGEWVFAAGNPCKPLRARVMKDTEKSQ